jgi:hypothetical protein
MNFCRFFLRKRGDKVPNARHVQQCRISSLGFQVPDELFSQPEVQRLVVTNTVTEEYANIR